MERSSHTADSIHGESTVYTHYGLLFCRGTNFPVYLGSVVGRRISNEHKIMLRIYFVAYTTLRGNVCGTKSTQNPRCVPLATSFPIREPSILVNPLWRQHTLA